MDYLFGKEIDINIYEKQLVNGKLKMDGDFVIYIDHWSISKDMIKKIRISINYNEKKY